MKMSKPKLALSLTVLLGLTLLSFLPIIEIQAQEQPWIILELERVYGIKGETIDLTAYSNNENIQVLIYNPSLSLIYNQTWTSNTTRQIPIGDTLPYGTYLIEGQAEKVRSQILFTVLDVTGWSLATFPHVVMHDGLTYTFFSNWTWTVENDEILKVNLQKLKTWVDAFDLDVTPLYNSMNFLVRFKKGSIFALDLTFSFIHKGCKLIANGTLDQPRSFSFHFETSRLRNLLNGIKKGSVVFDWSDIKKAQQAFSYDRENQLLTVQLPQTFKLDPYIFEAGFEDGEDPPTEFDSETTVGSTGEVSDTVAYDSTYSYRWHDTGGSGYSKLGKNIADTNPLYFYSCVYISIFPTTDDNSLASFNPIYPGGGSGSYIVAVAVYANTTSRYWNLRVLNGVGYEVVYADPELYYPSLDEWHEVEVACYEHATLGWGALIVNGTVVLNVTDVDTDKDGTPGYLIGGVSYSDDGDGDNEMELYFDNYIADDERISEEGGVEHLFDSSASTTHSTNVFLDWTLEFYSTSTTVFSGFVEALTGIVPLIPVEVALALSIIAIIIAVTFSHEKKNS